MEWLADGLDAIFSFGTIVWAGIAAFFLILGKGLMAIIARLSFFLKSKSSQSNGGGSKSRWNFNSFNAMSLFAAGAEDTMKEIKRCREVLDMCSRMRLGPYAANGVLQKFIHPSFVERNHRLREHLQRFDALEDELQRFIHPVNKEWHEIFDPILTRKEEVESHLVMTFAHFWNHIPALLRFNKKMRQSRGRFFRNLQVWISFYKFWDPESLWGKEKAFKRKYRIRAAKLHRKMEFFLGSYLHDRLFSYESDLHSFELSCMCGNVKEYLLQPEYDEMRSYLGLEGLDLSTEAIVKELAPRGVNWVRDAGSSIANPDTMFEAYLRILLYINPHLRQKWGVSLAFLEQCAAPAGLGIAQQKHMHIADSQSWWDRVGIQPDLPIQECEEQPEILMLEYAGEIAMEEDFFVEDTGASWFDRFLSWLRKKQ